jgi:hypothetical protein
MQSRLRELAREWKDLGVDTALQCRIGIHTGYCTVGNFGSDDRMDYTIIGAEANLAARLQATAEPGKIVMSYETYALVRDIAVAHALPPISMKGISREIIPHVVDSVVDESGARVQVFSEHMAGVDLFIDPSMVDGQAVQRVRQVLQDAIAALDKSDPAARPA